MSTSVGHQHTMANTSPRRHRTVECRYKYTYQLLFCLLVCLMCQVSSWTVGVPWISRRISAHRALTLHTYKDSNEDERSTATLTIEPESSEMAKTELSTTAMAAGLVSSPFTSVFNDTTLPTGIVISCNEQIRRMMATTQVGPDPATKPDYESLVGPLGRFLDNVFLNMFKDKLAEQVLGDLYENDDGSTTAYDRWKAEQSQRHSSSSNSTGVRKVVDDLVSTATVAANYTEIVQLAAALNARFRHDPLEVQRRAQCVLQNLFPSWLPAQYSILFAAPFPVFSARMNAHVTAVAGVWLMGECVVNDINATSATASTTTRNTISAGPGRSYSGTTAEAKTVTAPSVSGQYQGVLVTRCRFLEESGCASVCVNSCKIPTQNFFRTGMGVPLTMEPDYATGSCQFSFGRLPDAVTEAAALSTPCLARCPTAGSYRLNHQTGGSERGTTSSSSSSSSLGSGSASKDAAIETTVSDESVETTVSTNCFMMSERT